jgi:hypothetical protein
MLEVHGTPAAADTHLDLSFGEPASWPGLAGDAMKSLWISLGDPVSGPALQLGSVVPVPMEMFTPTHFHGSDQFRLVIAGEMIVSKEHMLPGRFGYQEAGRAYREAAAVCDSLAIVVIMGDRRGALTVFTQGDGDGYLEALGGADAFDSQLDRPLGKDEESTLPDGPKGTTAIASTVGAPHHGYLWGSFDDAASWPALGSDTHASATLFGDETSGPIAYLVKCGPNELVMPTSTTATEVLTAVAKGSLRIGDAEYATGDLRIQQADCPQDAIVSGPNGVEALVMIADRRADPVIDDGDEAACAWRDAVDELVSGLATAGV